MSNLKQVIDELVTANHVLANENVVDAFGHVSIRNPENPNHYFISRSRSPHLVTPDDIMEFDLEGNSVDGSELRPYAERHIHGAIMESRPEINSVVHNHSYSVIPFGLTGVKLRPAIHVGSGIGEDIGVWDIHDNFGDTDLLVKNMDHGRDLAKFLGQSTVVLMRGHGCTVAGRRLKDAVLRCRHRSSYRPCNWATSSFCPPARWKNVRTCFSATCPRTVRGNIMSGGRKPTVEWLAATV